MIHGSVRRTAACLAAVWTLVLAAVAAGAPPASATALPIGQCTTSSGVILAVDFSRWGGPLLRSCGTTPTTGYTLLNQGGWQTTGTQHDGPAFICRIGYAGYRGGKQYPTPKDEPCVLTPPATAYWSYWHADPGQNSWSYSQLGAMSYHPKPGSVDLWIFGATNISGTKGRPTFSPDTVRAHTTALGEGTKKPTPPPPVRRTPATTTTARPRTTDPDASPTISGTPTAVTLTPSPSGYAPPGTTPSPSTSAAAPPQPQDAEPTAAAGHSSGSVLPAAITAAALAVIAAAVVWRVRQRRRNAE
jgi:hypothetical protein